MEKQSYANYSPTRPSVFPGVAGPSRRSLEEDFVAVRVRGGTIASQSSHGTTTVVHRTSATLGVYSARTQHTSVQLQAAAVTCKQVNNNVLVNNTMRISNFAQTNRSVQVTEQGGMYMRRSEINTVSQGSSTTVIIGSEQFPSELRVMERYSSYTSVSRQW